MRLKHLIAATAAAVLASAASAAPLTYTAPVAVTSNPFTDVVVGSITLSGTSDVDGFAYYLESLTATVTGLGSVVIPYAAVTFSNGAVGSFTDVDLSNGFHFSGLSAGTYDIKLSGSFTGGSSALVGAAYSVTPVPEPETYAMMLAGLGAIGFMARRRQAK